MSNRVGFVEILLRLVANMQARIMCVSRCQKYFVMYNGAQAFTIWKVEAGVQIVHTWIVANVEEVSDLQVHATRNLNSYLEIKLLEKKT